MARQLLPGACRRSRGRDRRDLGPSRDRASVTQDIGRRLHIVLRDVEIPIEDMAVLQPVDGPSGPAAASPGTTRANVLLAWFSVKPYWDQITAEQPDPFD